MPSHLFVFSLETRRWIPASIAGAHELAVSRGWDVFYGIMPPRRDGIPLPWQTPGVREHAWQAFLGAIRARQIERRRLSAIFLTLN